MAGRIECLSRGRCSPETMRCALEQDTLSSAKYWFNTGRNVQTIEKTVDWDVPWDVKNQNKQIIR